MSGISFDQHGYIIPYDTVSLDWVQFIDLFGFSDERRQLLADYSHLLAELSKLVPVEHKHWLGGSFVTQKAIPDDLDVVIFVPYHYFSQTTDELRQLKTELASQIDCYFVEVFPKEHRKYSISFSDELTWYHFFRTDRRKNKKGIVELIVNGPYGNQ